MLIARASIIDNAQLIMTYNNLVTDGPDNNEQGPASYKGYIKIPHDTYN